MYLTNIVLLSGLALPRYRCFDPDFAWTVLDKEGDTSFLTTKEASYVDGKLALISYMYKYPSPLCIPLKHTEALPETLADTCGSGSSCCSARLPPRAICMWMVVSRWHGVDWMWLGPFSVFCVGSAFEAGWCVMAHVYTWYTLSKYFQVIARSFLSFGGFEDFIGYRPLTVAKFFLGRALLCCVDRVSMQVRSPEIMCFRTGGSGAARLACLACNLCICTSSVYLCSVVDALVDVAPLPLVRKLPGLDVA